MPVVDKINVDGQEYTIEPVMDTVPTEDSPNAVSSGGVYDALLQALPVPTPQQGGNKAFSNGGAYDYLNWLLRISGGGVFKPIASTNGTNPSGATFLIYAFDKWIAGGYKNNNFGLRFSLDNGFHWGLPFFNKTDVYTINTASAAYSDGRMVVSGLGEYKEDGTAIEPSTSEARGYWSDDGVHWEPCTISGGSASDRLSPVIGKFGGLWFAGGSFNSTGGIYWSEDGKAWTKGTGMSGQAYAVSYADGMWIASSYGDGLWWSTDGKAWTKGTMPSGSPSGTAGTFFSIEYGNGVWVASTAGGSLASYKGLQWSEDGKNWTVCTTQTTEGILPGYPKFINGRWFAAGAGANPNYAQTSLDGKFWDYVTGLDREKCFSEFTTDGEVILVTGNIVAWSTDAVTWHEIMNARVRNYSVHSLVYNGKGMWLGKGTSFDGSTFESTLGYMPHFRLPSDLAQ